MPPVMNPSRDDRVSVSVMSPSSDRVVASARRAIAGALVALAVAGCGSHDGPPPPTATGPIAQGASAPAVTDFTPSDAPDFLVQQLTGAWRRSPIILDERHIAIISDACAAAAREELGEVEANLPTAVVDARGEHFATAILADDLNAVECLARVDDTGETATVDSIDRLAISAVEPVEDAAISVASVVHATDLAGGRTIAFGRVGSKADAAKVSFDDASVVLATDSEGWWAMWWRGTVRAAGYSAVDPNDLVIGSAKPFAGEREARVGAASWWIDPAAKPTPASTTITAFIEEQACASGKTPDGRIEKPRIDLTATDITVTFEIRKLPGDQDCQGNEPFAISIKLPEALGDRKLLDGGASPPRDASTVPTG
jgi:hypothetical protein